MFIEKDGEVKVELYVRTLSNGAVRVEQKIEDVPEKDRGKYEKITFAMKPLTWRQHNEVQRSATVNRGPGMGSELDWVLYKERKLCTVLVGWDARGKEGKDAEGKPVPGKPIPVTDDNVLRLAPQVAETLLNEFDRATIMGDEDRKNS